MIYRSLDYHNNLLKHNWDKFLNFFEEFLMEKCNIKSDFLNGIVSLINFHILLCLLRLPHLGQLNSALSKRIKRLKLLSHTPQ